MKRLTIAARLWLPVAALGVMMVALTAVSVVRTTRSQAESAIEQQRQQHKLTLAMQWASASEANAARTTALLQSADTALAAAIKPELDTTSARIAELQKALEPMLDSEAEKAAFAKSSEVRKGYIGARVDALKLRGAGDDAAMPAALEKFKQNRGAYLAAQQALVQAVETGAEALRDEVGRQRLHTVWLVAGVMAAVVAALALSSFTLVRSIHRPLRRVVEVADGIAAGDLSARIEVDRNDELGDVQRALARMTESLRSLVGEVRHTADSLSVASAEIATGNQDLSQRTESAAANLQQTAGAIAQLTQTVGQSADAASQANQLASSAAAVAQRGGQVVSQVVSTMDDIHASSKKIADIIGVIDGIAFQTNILALNAAVEAARAGEQGRGFAVVAGEVRSLAQRSAEAAKEIKGLIGGSVDKVAAGSRLVQDAGQTMGEIVASVQRVTDIIGEITAAAGEQSGGIGQVHQAVGQLDRMTQQNAALVEQSAAAAESLKDQASRLAGMVSGFRLAA
jgi:methyl-accepting chemotaxis protein